MEAEKILPLALGAGVVLAVVMAKNGNRAGAPNVVQLGPTEPDPAVLESVSQSGETARAKIGAIGQIAGSVFDMFSTQEVVRGQNRVANLAAWRDVNVASIEGETQARLAHEVTKSGVAVAAIQGERDVAVSNAETLRDKVQAGYNFRGQVANAQRDTIASFYDHETAKSQAWANVTNAQIASNTSIATAQISAGRDLGLATSDKERDIAIAQEQTRQETIRANSYQSTAAIQGKTQEAVTKAQERGDTTRSIVQGVTTIGGAIIGTLFGNPGAGATVGGKVGDFFGRLF